MVTLVCPDCRTPLDRRTDVLWCAPCGQEYPIVNGIPRFEPEDPFYRNEERWSHPDRATGGLRIWLVRKQRFFVRRLAGRGGTLLDLGCGGGWALFAQGREAVGVDIAQRSLEAARTLYPLTVAAHWTKLPFPDNSFDLVVSSDVLGHVPFEEKDRVFSELYRVLKPGGRTLHYIEAEGVDPLTRFARRWPAAYRKHFIEPEGHIGMERPTAIFARFRRHGFKPCHEEGAYKVLVYVNRTVQLYDGDYARRSRLLALWVWAAKAALRTRATETLGNLAVAAALEIGDRLLPVDWGSGVLVEYEK
ncbi:MAG: methyltransferase domain-containing protein [Chloroflexota bacterium]|nr:methyltransferase domain-containing protein [Dehalococcoidia bacterium]MDW8254889.1 methyltransferase domain-containing protein [Chloroflexota bacterium]